MVKQGSIIKLNLNPTIGHEQAGSRPALVISSALFTRATNLTLICPITNTDRKRPLHIKLNNLQTTGFVMIEQIRAVDLNGRKFKIIDFISKDDFIKISNVIKSTVDLFEDDFE